jgi:Icc-related predicted phosphoesterase
MRIFFCSDLHASRKCWLKFLKSASFYGADVIIVGGDITGKFVVPLIEGSNRTRTATFLGVERTVSTPEEATKLRTWIADAGQYPVDMTPDEYAWHEGDQSRIDELFRRLVLDRVREWVAEADEKLAGSGVRVFVSGANDDFLEVDDVLASSDVIEDPNGRVIDLDDDYQLLGMGWGNPTPWACPRDIPEEELAAKIDAVVATARDPARTIFSLHVPPLGSGLDIAPRLDDYLRPRLNASGLDMISVGSTATRDAIERYQPLIGLHGHIHESKGIKKLAGVTIANPGSEYGEGVLDGLIVDLDRRRGLQGARLLTG